MESKPGDHYLSLRGNLVSLERYRKPIMSNAMSGRRSKNKRKGEAQHNNITAARAVAAVVRTTLGPKGMDKMLVDSMGDIVITNDDATILPGTILIISIIFIIIGIYFGGFYPFSRLFFIAVSFFYLPVLFLPEIIYSIIPSRHPDIDTMIASQFNFQIGLMFVLGCVYAYLVSCAIIFIHRRKKFTI